MFHHVSSRWLLLRWPLGKWSSEILCSVETTVSVVFLFLHLVPIHGAGADKYVKCRRHNLSSHYTSRLTTTCRFRFQRSWYCYVGCSYFSFHIPTNKYGISTSYPARFLSSFPWKKNVLSLFKSHLDESGNKSASCSKSFNCCSPARMGTLCPRITHGMRASFESTFTIGLEFAGTTLRGSWMPLWCAKENGAWWLNDCAVSVRENRLKLSTFLAVVGKSCFYNMLVVPGICEIVIGWPMSYSIRFVRSFFWSVNSIRNNNISRKKYFECDREVSTSPLLFLSPIFIFEFPESFISFSNWRSDTFSLLNFSSNSKICSTRLHTISYTVFINLFFLLYHLLYFCLLLISYNDLCMSWLWDTCFSNLFYTLGVYYNYVLL